MRNDAGILYIADDLYGTFALLSTWAQEAIRNDHHAETDAITALDQTFGKIGLAVYNAYTMRAED